jgi:hypothetical protein
MKIILTESQVKSLVNSLHQDLAGTKIKDLKNYILVNKNTNGKR